MSEKKQNYNLVIGVIALLSIIVLIALIGYFVSKPKPLVIQGEAEAPEYRVSGKVPGLHRLPRSKGQDGPGTGRSQISRGTEPQSP